MQDGTVKQAGAYQLGASASMDTDQGLIVASSVMTDLLSIAERAAKSPPKC
jgi:hypothetical protein